MPIKRIRKGIHSGAESWSSSIIGKSSSMGGIVDVMSGIKSDLHLKRL